MRRHYIIFFLIISLLLTSCQPSAPSETIDQSFRKFTDSLFREWVCCDSLTLNYTLKEPGKFGITKLPRGFSSPSEDNSPSCQTENLLRRLHQYNAKELSLPHRILYDTLEDYLSCELDSSRYPSFSNWLNPSSGIQAQLPVLLAEFHLQTAQDVRQYFLLLQSVPGYFQSLLSTENEKKEAATLPARSSIQKIIQQCDHFITQNGANMIQSCFARQVKAQFPRKASSLITKHKSLLQHCVIPAYRDLSTGLTALLPFAPSDGSLASYADGRSYYRFLFREKTGSSQSVSDWQKKLTRRLKKAENQLISYATTDPAAFRTCEDYQSKFTSPDHILSTLQKSIRRDFPACPSTSYQLHYVDPSLQDYLSPAFYLTPPIDDRKSNAIYINHSPRYRFSSLFNTLAHEGYPGHLYQNCYLRSRNLPLLRYILDFPAYTEGYATYAEVYSYRYTGASAIETGILQNNTIATHCIYALCDIGIHYQHWTKMQLRSFLETHGITGEENIRHVYEAIIESPGSYLPYTIGYLQIEELRPTFHSDMDFHTFLLDMGPTSFEIIKKYQPLSSEEHSKR